MYAFFKFLWYLLSRALIWALGVGLVVLAFFMAMDYMNASTLTKDGMQVRAEVVIEGSDPSTLTKVFSKAFLESDTLLTSNAYLPYKVSDFDYKADSNIDLIFPWQDSVTLRITEKVSNIQAQVTPDPDSGLSDSPPAWQNAIYDVKLVRYEGGWRITSMSTVKILPPSPTPTPADTDITPEPESPSGSPAISVTP